MTAMRFIPVVDAAELWEGEMDAFDVGDREILVIRLADGFHAFDGICPHQSFSLVEGSLDAGTLTCRAHEWQFDAATGCGINPRGTCLVPYATEVIDGVLHVSEQPVPGEARVGIQTGASR